MSTLRIFLKIPDSHIFILFFIKLIRLSFRETHWTRLAKNQKMLILDPKMGRLPYFELNMSFHLKFKTVTFNQLLIPFLRYSFRKTQYTDFEKTQKVLILVPKILHLPHFEHNKTFSWKSKTPLLPAFFIRYNFEKM